MIAATNSTADPFGRATGRRKRDDTMATDLDILRKQQAEELAALKAQQKDERDMRKMQRTIRKSRAKKMRSKARQAAKETYPDSNLVLVWNGRPIAVREVERPAQIVRSPNILPRAVRNDNILPRASYNIIASQNARCACGSSECRGCGGCTHSASPMASPNARPMASPNARLGIDVRTILRYGTYAGGVTHPDGDTVQFLLNDGTRWEIYLNECFGDRAPSDSEIIRSAYKVECIDNGVRKASAPKKPSASKNIRPRSAPAKRPATKKASSGGRKSR